MLKEYKIPLAIVISSIIISYTIWYTQTYKDRARYNFCVESNSENIAKDKLDEAMKNSIHEVCHIQTYIER